MYFLVFATISSRYGLINYYFNKKKESEGAEIYIIIFDSVTSWVIEKIRTRKEINID
jgi:hypothetical protein